MEIKERMERIFNDHGIEIDSEDGEMDSFEFISMIIDVENEFDIVVPDEFLSISSFDIGRLVSYVISVTTSSG